MKSVRYEGAVEWRNNERILIMTRTIEEVPVSKRGTEWSRGMTTTTTMTEVALSEVPDLVRAYVDALTYEIVGDA